MRATPTPRVLSATSVSYRGLVGERRGRRGRKRGGREGGGEGRKREKSGRIEWRGRERRERTGDEESEREKSQNKN